MVSSWRTTTTKFNAFVTYGSWVPRNIEAGTADPKPK